MFLKIALFAMQVVARYDGRILADEDCSHLSVDVGANVRVPVMRDGSFNFQSSTGGAVELRVVNLHGDRIHSEVVILRAGYPIEIRLRSAAPRGGPPLGPISVTRLLHKPSKRQSKLRDQSDELARRGDFAGSVAKLEEALASDPRWFEAWINIGSRQVRLRQFESAAESFRRAIQIDPNAAIAHNNFALSLLFLNRPADAEAAAFRALECDPSFLPAKYAAGLALLRQRRRVPQAIELLESAAPQIPHAREILQGWKNGAR